MNSNNDLLYYKNVRCNSIVSVKESDEKSAPSRPLYDMVFSLVSIMVVTYGMELQAHPDARSFRIKTIPYYNDLCLIYGDAVSEPRGN